jgi:cell wall-associated NlpC family hydrolase
MRRLLVLACSLVLAGGAAATSTHAGPNRSWADAQIRLVTAHGLMGGDAEAFRPDDPITLGELADLAAGLTGRPAAAPTQPARRATMRELDARLVAALGLGSAARSFTQAVRATGLAPPNGFGTEVTARLLGLRTNHPAAQDALERTPSDPAPRAEAAFSAARILGFSGWETAWLSTTTATFSLPQLSDWQRRVLQTAVRFVGYPYVWGGTSERAQAPFGKQVPGGFDCSGFVWRVFKLERYPEAPALAETLRGRTTFAMAGEVPASRRIRFAALQPADLIFFGDRGPSSRPAQVGHMGIYLGNGWFVHSSRYGVALEQLAGWYRDRFAWGRRPLAEAGLARAA